MNNSRSQSTKKIFSQHTASHNDTCYLSLGYSVAVFNQVCNSIQHCKNDHVKFPVKFNLKNLSFKNFLGIMSIKTSHSCFEFWCLTLIFIHLSSYKMSCMVHVLAIPKHHEIHHYPFKIFHAQFIYRLGGIMHA